MTLATGWKKQYEGNGSATNFSYPYYFVANADLKVVHRSTAGVETTLTSGVDYTLTGAGTLNGNVEFPTGGSFSTLAADEYITIAPDVDVAENTDLKGDYQWSPLNASKDAAMRVSQQQQEEIDRSLKQPIPDLDSLDMTLPNSIDRASKQLGFDENGEPITTIAITNTITSGSGAPTSTPTNLGDQYIDTTNKIIYEATGTSSSSDWNALNVGAGFALMLTGSGKSLAQGDGAAYFPIPSFMDGMNLVRAQVKAGTAGATGSTTIDVYNLTDTVDMLDTAITLASGAVTGTPGVVDTDNDDVATDDLLRIDVTTVSTTAPIDVSVSLEFKFPT
jgi:hypothetical protein